MRKMMTMRHCLYRVFDLHDNKENWEPNEIQTTNKSTICLIKDVKLHNLNSKCNKIYYTFKSILEFTTFRKKKKSLSYLCFR